MNAEDFKTAFAGIVGLGNWPIQSIDLSLKITLTTLSIVYVSVRLYKEFKK